jgi:hypothetical protein
LPVDKWIDLISTLGPYVLGMTGLLVPLAIRASDRKHERQTTERAKADARRADRKAMYMEVLRLTKGMTTIATIIQKRKPTMTPGGGVVDNFIDDGRELRAMSGRIAALASERASELYDEAILELMDFVLIAKLAKDPDKPLNGWGGATAAETWTLVATSWSP